jgi:hypothetical protein
MNFLRTWIHSLHPKSLRVKSSNSSQDAFDQMEQRLSQIHYYFTKNQDLSLQVRQVMTYRKLIALDYFTPEMARQVLRQWIQDEQQMSKSEQVTAR